jgi:hypothetical protein
MEIEIAGLVGSVFAATSVGALVYERQMDVLHGIPIARGGEWSSPQVMRIVERLDPLREEEAAAA